MVKSRIARVYPTRTESFYNLFAFFGQLPRVAHVRLNFANTSPAIAAAVFRQRICWVIEDASTNLTMPRFFDHS